MTRAPSLPYPTRRDCLNYYIDIKSKLIDIKLQILILITISYRDCPIIGKFLPIIESPDNQINCVFLHAHINIKFLKD